MNILLIGGGGREHAMADKIVASPLCKRLFIAPGNAGTAILGHNVALEVSDFKAIKNLVIKEDIGLVIVGPEAPLVHGIVDYFGHDEVLQNIPIIGPSASGARLEGSKDFAKEFMQRHKIPTADYASFGQDQLKEAITHIQNHSMPIVLKADGLAAGKGVIICEDKAEAKAEEEV